MLLHPELTFQSHFKFGYDRNGFVLRSSPKEKWWVEYGSCQKNPQSFRLECIETAKTIRNRVSEDIWILFSGGIDSEVCLRSFVEANIEVRVGIARFKGDLNIHDISWAVLACEELNIPYHFFELDLFDFWQSQALEYAEISQCISPQLVVTMWLSDQVEGYPVLGGGDCLFVKENNSTNMDNPRSGLLHQDISLWNLWEKERIAAWYRFFLARNREACPGFFQYRPEIILSYIQDQMVNDLFENKFPGVSSSQSIKLAVYQQHFKLRSRPKYTGFEKVQAQDAELRKILVAKFPHSDEIYKTGWKELSRILSPRSETE